MEQTDQQPHTGCHSCHSFMAKNSGTLLLLLILAGAFLLALTIKTTKEIAFVGGGIAPTNAISVSGTGEVVVVPDTGEFTFSIIEEGDTATAVRDAGTAKADATLATLKEKGIEEKDIKTTAYELQPKYEWEPLNCVMYPCDRKQVQKGFTLNQSVRVKVRDLDKAGEVLEAVTNKGVQNISGLSFTNADDDKTKADARKLAIDQARAKAEKLANDLGVSLVRIIGFSEDGGYPMPYYAESMSSGMGGDMMAKTAPAIPAGENTVTSNVSITYEIR
jgi:uncharacterized protein